MPVLESKHFLIVHFINLMHASTCQFFGGGMMMMLPILYSSFFAELLKFI